MSTLMKKKKIKLLNSISFLVFLFFLKIVLFTSCIIIDVKDMEIETILENKTINDDNWIVTFEDNFNSLDTESWSFIPKGQVAWNKYMTDNPKCYEFENGALNLKGFVNDDSISTFMTGGIWTRDKKTIDLGKIEIRAKINKVNGAWPALWMLSNDKRWPEGGEIDIAETVNHENSIIHTVHTPYTLNYSDGAILNHMRINVKDKSEYNIYGLIINQNELIFTINGFVSYIYKRIFSEIDNQFPFGEGNNMFLILSMQLDNIPMTGKSVDTSGLPSIMCIDWVKFYKKINNDLPDYQIK